MIRNTSITFIVFSFSCALTCKQDCQFFRVGIISIDFLPKFSSSAKAHIQVLGIELNT